MSTVSRREWLRESTGEAELEDLDDNLGEHATDDDGKRPGMHERQPNRRSRIRHRGAAPAPGGSNIPTYPAPLPGNPVHIDHQAMAVDLRDGRTQTLDVGAAESAYLGINAHGVQPDIHYGGRPAPNPTMRTAHEANKVPDSTPLPKIPDPVPVYVVPEYGAGGRPLQRASYRRVQVPQAGTSGGIPTIVANKNPRRTEIKILNESTASTIYLLNDSTDATGGAGGAVLPTSMTSYLRLHTQDAIYAIGSGTAATYISVIDEYSVPGGA
jgi:hypothetical protein